MEQIGIAVFGVIAVWLSQDKRESWRRYACLFGLAGQPFWIWTAVIHEQWGIQALTALYTWAWARGAWANWIKPRIA